MKDEMLWVVKILIVALICAGCASEPHTNEVKYPAPIIVNNSGSALKIAIIKAKRIVKLATVVQLPRSYRKIPKNVCNKDQVYIDLLAKKNKRPKIGDIKIVSKIVRKSRSEMNVRFNLFANVFYFVLFGKRKLELRMFTQARCTRQYSDYDTHLYGADMTRVGNKICQIQRCNPFEVGQEYTFYGKIKERKAYSTTNRYYLKVSAWHEMK